MQKASAAAEEAGLSFEWLGAYIATVSEKTRQAPEVIGTAYNAIIARLHNIKTKGFNEEDETRINDIAKALATLPEPLKLIDSLTGEWMSMSDIFSGIAAQWDTLDSKQRAYIATTMAGTRQQNMFITLMNDMAKGAEGGSRAIELYNGALSAAGNASQKYSVYQESIVAKQEEANAKWEEFYNVLSKTEALSAYYELMGNIGKGLAVATEETGGFNLAMIALGATGLVVVAVGNKMIQVLRDMNVVIASMEQTANYTKIGLIISAIAAVIGIVTSITSAVSAANNELKKTVDYSSIISEKKTSIGAIEPLIKEYENLAKKTRLTILEQERMDELFSKIKGSSTGFDSALDNASSSVENMSSNLKIMNDELERQHRILVIVSSLQAKAALSNPDNIKKWAEANKQLIEASKEYSSVKTLQDFGLGAVVDLNIEEGKKQISLFLEAYRNYKELVNVHETMTSEPGKSYVNLPMNPAGTNGRHAYSGKYSELSILNLIEDNYNYGLFDSRRNNMSSVTGNPYANLTYDQFKEIFLALDNLYGIDGGDWFNPSVKMSQDELLNASDANLTYLTAAEQQAQALNEIVSTVVSTEEEAMEKLTSAERAEVEKKIAEFLPTNLDALADEKSLDTAIKQAQIQLPSIIDAVEQDLSVETDAIGAILDGIFPNPEAFEKAIETRNNSFSSAAEEGIEEAGYEMGNTRDEVIEFLSHNFSSDEFEKVVENISNAHKGDKKALNTFWDNWLKASDDDKVKILQTWQDSLLGMTQEMNKLVQDEMTFELPEGSEGPFSILTEYLINGDNGYSPEDILEYYGRIREAVDAGRITWEEFSNMFSEDGLDGSAFENFNEKLLGTSTDEWLEEQRALTEGTVENWRSFFERMSELSPDDEEGAMSFIEKLMGSSEDTESLDNAAAAFRNLGDEAKEAFKEAIPMSEEFWKDLEDGGEITDETREEMKRLQKELKAKNFKDVYKAVRDLRNGVTDTKDAYAEFTDELKNVNEAQGEFEKAGEKVAKGAKLEAADIQNLANVLGYTMPNAAKFMTENWDLVSDKFTSLKDELVSLKEQMDLASFIQITGTSIADFSALENGLLSTKGLAEATVAALRATGSWKLEKVETVTTASTINPLTGETGIISLPAESEVLSYTGTDGLFDSPNTSSGGGGVGGNNGPSADDQMLNDMDWNMNKIEQQLEHLHAIMQGYENQGYLTGLINALEMENDLLEQQSELLEENIRRLEKRLRKLRAQLANMTPGTEEYNNLLATIEALQDALAQYNVQLAENAAQMAENEDAAEEYADQIRDMEIELRDLIEQAIRDRIEREKEALDARVEMEEMILDAIIARHERERDEILETTEAQINALEEEIDALNEAFEERKRLAEEEDKQEELASLEARYNQMIVDPTRAREAQDLLKEIQELRDEIAWDTAEQEVQAQEEALEEQITSLEDYAEYIEQFYQDLIENPSNFIDEINEVLAMSNEQIIAWLQENNEEFANSTDAMQQQTVASWTETLNTMNGVIVTYWDEVEEIIAGGEEAIIAFLMENSQDFAEAGHLQAEAYVDAWMELLEDLQNAYEDMIPEIDDPYETNTSGAGGSGSGGGGGGGNGGGSPAQTPQKKWYVVNGATTLSGPFATKDLASNSRQNGISRAYSNWSMNWNDAGLMAVYQRWNSSTLKEFAKGGIADFTGPAWLDGTKSKPERILSAYQTTLFEDLISSLHSIKMKAVSMPSIKTEDMAAPVGMTFTGDIIVNVEKLDEDTDYEELGERIMSSMMAKANRGSAVGGIRITR